ncbi:hypothetical protein PPGU19_061630 (plasmid) [Paraburkholderia sp. PGU19]|nr:hypothetical protein PPGU19_061630 [Paraburkholderia sp. PGU19]
MTGQRGTSVQLAVFTGTELARLQNAIADGATLTMVTSNSTSMNAKLLACNTAIEGECVGACDVVCMYFMWGCEEMHVQRVDVECNLSGEQTCMQDDNARDIERWAISASLNDRRSGRHRRA